MYHNEKLFNGQESESQLVFEVPGEPAVIINGVPDVTSVGVTCNHLDTTYNPAPTDDPALGEWLEGRKVRKLFGDQYYSGKVVKYDCQTKWYRVIYEDGDSEDLEWHELEELLLPLDISVPLLALALGKCKSEKLVPVSRTNTRKNPMKESMGSALELLQVPHVNERKDQNVMEANFSSGKTQGTLSMQREALVENLENRLQGLQQKESVSEPRVKVKRKYTKRNTMKKPKGLQVPQINGSQGLKLIEAKFSSERTQKGSFLPMQKESQDKNMDTQMQVCGQKEPVSKPGEEMATSISYHNSGSVAIMLEMFQRTETAETNDVIVQKDLDKKSTAQESLKVTKSENCQS